MRTRRAQPQVPIQTEGAPTALGAVVGAAVCMSTHTGCQKIGCKVSMKAALTYRSIGAHPGAPQTWAQFCISLEPSCTKTDSIDTVTQTLPGFSVY